MSTLLTIPLAANLTGGTAGELTLELTALLSLWAGVVLAGEGPGLRVAGVVVAALAPAPHAALHARHQQVQGGGVLDGPGLVEGAPPDAVVHRARGGVGGRPVQVDDVAALVPPRLTGGVLLKGGYVFAEELPVDLEVPLVRRHVHQVPQVSGENSLEHILVQVAGVVVIAGVH